jgi:hypothetical protein
VAVESSSATPRSRYRAAQRTAPVAAAVGLIAAGIAFIDGIVLIVKRRVTPCPNGYFFPEGTKNFDCYAHPRLAEGLAVSALALALGALLVIVALVSLAVLKAEASAE